MLRSADTTLGPTHPDEPRVNAMSGSNAVIIQYLLGDLPASLESPCARFVIAIDSTPHKPECESQHACQQ